MSIAAHLELAKKGEELAAGHLLKKGYRIIFRNWRYHKAEIDIVARDDKALVFVEVKTRTTEIYGFPELAVSKKKQLLLSRAAEACIEFLQYSGEVRYDIVSIVTNQYKTDIFHIEDAFYPTF